MLDKANLSNAKTNEQFGKDIPLTGNQYNIVLSCYYVFYLVAAPPLVQVLKKVGASLTIAATTFLFGFLGIMTIFCTNFAGLMVLRLVLGATESLLFPGVVYYLSRLYRRRELARRIAIFYAGDQLAVAFTGLIAYGSFRIDGAIAGWKIMFIIEGVAAICASIFCLFMLPKSADSAWFLTPEERNVANMRILEDASTSVHDVINYRRDLKVFLNPLVAVWAVAYMLLGIPLFSTSTWFPQLVGSLGYGTLKTNAYTVAPNIVATAFLVAVALSSDRFKERAFHIAGCAGLCMIGFIILATINPTENSSQVAVGYFSTFLLAMGNHSPSPVFAAWINNNIVSDNERSLASPVLITMANAMGLVASNIFFEDEAPRYMTALYINIGCGAAALVLIISIGLWMRWENRRRDKILGYKLTPQSVPTKELVSGSKDLRFRYMA